MFTLFRSFSYFPRDPVIFSDNDWDVQSPPQRIVFGFHYHSQEVIGSLGIQKTFTNPNQQLTGWWFQIFFIFTPTWGNDPI